MKNLIHSLYLLFLFVLLSASSKVDNNQNFLSFLENEWKFELSQSPVYATAMGVKAFELVAAGEFGEMVSHGRLLLMGGK